jgi:hypothetical protein
MRTFTGQAASRRQPGAPADEEGPRGPQTTVPMAAGMNRATWDLAHTPVVSFPGMILWGATQNGPTVLPGTYQVKLTADGVSQTQPLHDREAPAAQHQRRRPAVPVGPGHEDPRQGERSEPRRHQDPPHQDEAAEKTKGAPKEVVAAADTLTKNLAIVVEEIYQVKNQSGQDPLNFPIRTNNRLASLLRVAVTGEGRPTSNVVPIFDDLAGRAEGGAGPPRQDARERPRAAQSHADARSRRTPISPK